MQLLIFVVAVLALSTAHAQTVPPYATCAAQNYQEILGCTTSLTNCFNNTQNSFNAQDYCPCLINYFTCVMAICPEFETILQTYKAQVNQICVGAFNLPAKCYYQLYNDPHIHSPHFAAQTCNIESFPNVYTSSGFSISATAASNSAWTNTAATALQEVNVTYNGVTYSYNKNSNTNFGSATVGDVTITSKRIFHSGTGESINIIERPTWINLEVFGYCEGTGTFFSGCPSRKRNEKRNTAPDNVNCAQLTGEYKQSCNFDMQATNGDTNYASAAADMAQRESSSEQYFSTLAGSNNNAAGALSLSFGVITMAVAFLSLM